MRLIICLIAGLTLGTGVGYLITAAEYAARFEERKAFHWQNGFEYGYERGVKDALNECLEAIKRPRPKPMEPRA